jgi:gliding motility-associated-like protein
LNSLTRFVFPGTDFDLVVESEHGCRSNFNISAKLNYNCADPIYVPTAFTPDGDGINDIFKPVMPGVKLLSFKIYNRWGEQIFETSDSTEGWDGAYREIEAKSDVYVWRMEYVDKYDKELVEEGKVNLLR